MEIRITLFFSPIALRFCPSVYAPHDLLSLRVLLRTFYGHRTVSPSRLNATLLPSASPSALSALLPLWPLLYYYPAFHSPPSTAALTRSGFYFSTS
jgi:hypothetical protein